MLRHAQRTTGFFKIRGININHGEFEDLMLRMAPVNDFKCEAFTIDALDVLRVCVEIKRDADPVAAVALVQRDQRVFELTPRVETLEPERWPANSKLASRHRGSWIGAVNLTAPGETASPRERRGKRGVELGDPLAPADDVTDRNGDVRRSRVPIKLRMLINGIRRRFCGQIF